MLHIVFKQLRKYSASPWLTTAHNGHRFSRLSKNLQISLLLPDKVRDRSRSKPLKVKTYLLQTRPGFVNSRFLHDKIPRDVGPNTIRFQYDSLIMFAAEENLHKTDMKN